MFDAVIDVETVLQNVPVLGVSMLKVAKDGVSDDIRKLDQTAGTRVQKYRNFRVIVRLSKRMAVMLELPGKLL